MSSSSKSQTNLAQSIFGILKLVQMKGQALFNSEINVFFLKISNKLGTKHLWNTQISSNEGPSPFPQWDKCLLPQNLNQTWHKASFGEFDSKLFKGGSRSFSKGDGSNFKPASVYNHSFAQTCCLLGNVAEVSSVANGPLVWFALYTHCNFLL